MTDLPCNSWCGDLRFLHADGVKSGTLARYIKESISEDVDVVMTDAFSACLLPDETDEPFRTGVTDVRQGSPGPCCGELGNTATTTSAAPMSSPAQWRVAGKGIRGVVSVGERSELAHPALSVQSAVAPTARKDRDRDDVETKTNKRPLTSSTRLRTGKYLSHPFADSRRLPRTRRRP